jgi:hypothetical protein
MVPHHDIIVNAQILDAERTVWEQHKWYNYPNLPQPVYPMAFCLTDPGYTYLIYLPYGGWVDIKLTSDQFKVIWLDPRNGKIFNGVPSNIFGKGKVRLQPPDVAVEPNDPGDWVLFIENENFD